jgi:hypothetical protein
MIFLWLFLLESTGILCYPCNNVTLNRYCKGALMKDLPHALPEPIISNPKSINIFLIVVSALATLGVLAVVGGVVLAYADKQLPESVIVLGSVAVGALAGMVAPNSR